MSETICESSVQGLAFLDAASAEADIEIWMNRLFSRFQVI